MSNSLGLILVPKSNKTLKSEIIKSDRKPFKTVRNGHRR